MQKQIRREFKGNVGLFLLCAELSKHNLVALPTSRNTAGYDLVVLNPETNMSLGLQIKCTDRGEYPVISTHWCDYQESIDRKIVCDFVFVDISNLDAPIFHVVLRDDMRTMLKKDIVGDYLDNYRKRHNTTLEEMLRAEREEKRKSNLWVAGLHVIARYESDLEAIHKKLEKEGE